MVDRMAGVRGALAILAVLWIVLVAWALRHAEQLFPQAGDVAASARSSVPPPSSRNVDGGEGEGIGDVVDERPDTVSAGAAAPEAGDIADVSRVARGAGESRAATDDGADTSEEGGAGASAGGEASASTDEGGAGASDDGDGTRATDADAAVARDAEGGAGTPTPGPVAAAPMTLPPLVDAEPSARVPFADGRARESSARSLYEALRREELETLGALSERLRFPARARAPDERLRPALDRIFEILFLYAETAVEVRVRSNETGDTLDDRRLSRARAESIVDYLVARGLARDRFTLGVDEGGDLPSGTHRVTVRAKEREP